MAFKEYYTDEEAVQVDELREKIYKKSKNFYGMSKKRKAELDAITAQLEVIKMEAIRRNTGLEKYLVVEVLQYDKTTFKICIERIRAVDSWEGRARSFELEGWQINKTGAVSWLSGRAVHIEGNPIKRRHLNGTWTDLTGELNHAN